MYIYAYVFINIDVYINVDIQRERRYTYINTHIRDRKAHWKKTISELDNSYNHKKITISHSNFTSLLGYKEFGKEGGGGGVIHKSKTTEKGGKDAFTYKC